MADGNATKYTTEQAREQLRKRFAQPEWALMEEVAPSTGGGTTYADAVAFNLWSSRGHAVHGIEIKVSRSDWLRELKKPAKAEGVFFFCDYWWVVAPAGVVNEGELPPTWGLLLLNGRGLTVAAKAPQLEPKPLDRGFFASLMRRGTENIAATAGRMCRDAVRTAREESQQHIENGIKDRTRAFEQMTARVQKFEEATGLSFIEREWDGPPIEVIQLAKHLHALSDRWGNAKRLLGDLTHLADQLDRSAEIVRAAVAATGIQESKEPVDG